MTDNSGTTADEQSNRIGALAALDRAEQSTVNTADGQTLLLMGLVLITAGSAKVAFAGRQRCSRQRNRTICAEWRQERSSGSPVASSRMESFSCSSPASTGYPLYQAFWITGCWLGGFPVRSVSADTQGRVGIELHAGTDIPARMKSEWLHCHAAVMPPPRVYAALPGDRYRRDRPTVGRSHLSENTCSTRR
jgi:hypothetical protein